MFCCMHVHDVHVLHACHACERQERLLDPLKQKLKMSVMWMLGTEPRFSVRAAREPPLQSLSGFKISQLLLVL